MKKTIKIPSGLEIDLENSSKKYNSFKEKRMWLGRFLASKRLLHYNMGRDWIWYKL